MVRIKKPPGQLLEVPASARYGERMWLCQTCPRCRWSIIHTDYLIKDTGARVFLTRRNLWQDKETGKFYAPIHNLECSRPKKQIKRSANSNLGQSEFDDEHAC